jgi:hypothetical protein
MGGGKTLLVKLTLMENVSYQDVCLNYNSIGEHLKRLIL